LPVGRAVVGATLKASGRDGARGRPAVLPQTDVPQAVVPQGVVPQGVVPQGVMPQAVVPQCVFHLDAPARDVSILTSPEPWLPPAALHSHFPRIAWRRSHPTTVVDATPDLRPTARRASATDVTTRRTMMMVWP